MPDTTYIPIVSFNINGCSTAVTHTKLYDPNGKDHNGVSLNNNIVQSCVAQQVKILCIQETKLHDNSPNKKTTKEIVDPLNTKGYVCLENPNRDSVSKGGTSIIFLDTTDMIDIKTLYNDYDANNTWIHPKEPNASSGRIQIVSFKYLNETYYLINVYAPADGDKVVKISFFHFLRDLLKRPNLSHLKDSNTIAVGDWNIVEDLLRDSISLARDLDPNDLNHLEPLSAFNDFLDENILTDPLLITHENGDVADDANDEDPDHSNITFIHRNNDYFARLDRFYSSMKLQGKVKQVDTPIISISDHLPIKLILCPNNIPLPDIRMGSDIFRIKLDVIANTKNKQVVNEKIRKLLKRATSHQMAGSLDRPFTRYWEKAKEEIFQFYKEETHKLMKEITIKEKSLFLIINEKSQHTKEEKQKARDEFNLFINHKQAVNYASEFAYGHLHDEKMTKSFFSRRKRKRIEKSAIAHIVRDDSQPPTPPNIIQWESNPKELMAAMNKYWETILRKRIQDDDHQAHAAQDEVIETLEAYLDMNDLKLDPLDMEALGNLITVDEIRIAIHSIKLGKAPGKDGLPIEFYAVHSNSKDETINQDYLTKFLYKVYLESEQNKELPQTFNENIVTLIFKKHFEHQKKFPKNYRPITLQNLDYKILYKILALRLQKVIGKLIPHFQHAYVHGRKISDAILLMKAIIQKISKNNEGAAALFVDNEKAFDSVDHKFTERVMRAYKLPEKFITWVKMAFQSSQMQLKINGYLTDPFSMNGGGKQGDPLYPYIFIMVMAAMAAQIEMDDNIEGVKLSHCDTKIRTFQYADDCPYLLNAPGDLAIVQAKIAHFSVASGMKTNDEKTEILLIGTWSNNPPQTLIDSGFKLVKQKDTARVLGIQLGSNNSHLLNWSNVRSKIRKFLSSNSSDQLTLNGKIIIANSCITSQTIFVATHQHSDVATLGKIQSILNTFTNGDDKNRTYISFNDKCKPHINGGPLTTLLNPNTLCPLQSTKWFYEIAFNYPLDMREPTWRNEWVDTMVAYAKHFGLFHPDHILMSTIKPIQIRSTFAHDPQIINAPNH